jgi:hypothetical protein
MGTGTEVLNLKITALIAISHFTVHCSLTFKLSPFVLRREISTITNHQPKLSFRGFQRTSTIGIQTDR